MRLLRADGSMRRIALANLWMIVATGIVGVAVPAVGQVIVGPQVKVTSAAALAPWQECNIAAGQVSPNEVVVVAGTRYGMSLDGGTTWTTGIVPLSEGIDAGVAVGSGSDEIWYIAKVANDAKIT